MCSGHVNARNHHERRLAEIFIPTGPSRSWLTGD
jgi:hypothetical protein